MSWALVASLVAVVGAGHLVAYYHGRRAVAGMLKPVPILLLAWCVSASARPSASATLVAAGLVASAVGDVSLVFPTGFLAGLVTFFVAHLCYVAAFGPTAVWSSGGATVAVILAAAVGIMLRYLWPHVARLRGPVTAYATVLALMAWCAAARALGPSAEPGALLAAVGAASFLVSDGVLAVNRFARPLRGAHLVVMVTYYLAQLLIAASVG